MQGKVPFVGNEICQLRNTDGCGIPPRSFCPQSFLPLSSMNSFGEGLFRPPSRVQSAPPCPEDARLFRPRRRVRGASPQALSGHMTEDSANKTGQCRVRCPTLLCSSITCGNAVVELRMGKQTKTRFFLGVGCWSMPPACAGSGLAGMTSMIACLLQRAPSGKASISLFRMLHSEEGAVNPDGALVPPKH